MRYNTLTPRGWAYYINFLVTGGWFVIVSVWHWRINTPFTNNTHSILSIISRCKTYKYISRCSGEAIETCGTDRHALIIRTCEIQWARVQHFYLVCGEIPELTKKGRINQVRWPGPRLPWPGIVLVWQWHINTPLTPNKLNTLASSSRRNTNR